MFEVSWEFDIRPERASEFAAAYGPDGEWVRLFRRGQGFVGTEVKTISPTRWVTVDRWSSRAAYDAFRAAHAPDYEALDRRCAELTTAERKLGEIGQQPRYS